MDGVSKGLFCLSTMQGMRALIHLEGFMSGPEMYRNALIGSIYSC